MYIYGRTQLHLGSYIHPCTNEAHPPAHLQDLIPTLTDVYLVCVIILYALQSRD